MWSNLKSGSTSLFRRRYWTRPTVLHFFSIAAGSFLTSHFFQSDHAIDRFYRSSVYKREKLTITASRRRNGERGDNLNVPLDCFRLPENWFSINFIFESLIPCSTSRDAPPQFIWCILLQTQSTRNCRKWINSKSINEKKNYMYFIFVHAFTNIRVIILMVFGIYELKLFEAFSMLPCFPFCYCLLLFLL